MMVQAKGRYNLLKDLDQLKHSLSANRATANGVSKEAASNVTITLKKKKKKKSDKLHVHSINHSYFAPTFHIFCCEIEMAEKISNILYGVSI